MAHWYPFTTPKTLIIIGGTLLAGIFFCWGLIERKEESIKFTPVHFALLGFLSVLSIAGVVGIDPHTSFFGTFFSSVSISFLVILAALAALISEFTRRDFQFVGSVARAIFSSGVVVALVSYLPMLGEHGSFLALSGSGSTIGNSSFTGTFLLFTVGFGVYLALLAESWKRRAWSIAGILFVLACPLFLSSNIWHGAVSLRSPLSLSGEAQGAELGLVIFLLVSFSLLLTVVKNKNIKVAGVILLLLVSVATVWGYLGLVNPQSRIHQSFSEMKTGTRFVFWDISKEALSEKPLLGDGFENYQKVYQQHFDPIVFTEGYASEQWVTNPHNIIYDMAVSGGAMGVLGYMALLGVTLISFFKFAKSKGSNMERATIIFPGILLGYLVQNFFVFDTPTSFLAYFVCIGLAMGCWARERENGAGPFSGNVVLRKILGFGVITVFAVSLVVFVFLPFAESRAWARLQSLPVGSERVGLQEGVQGKSVMGSVSDDIVYALAVINQLDELRPNLKPEDKPTFMAEIDSLVVILKKDREKYPRNFFLPYRIGTLMHLAYSVEPARGLPYLDEARGYFNEALSLSPNYPRTYFSLAQNELFRKNPGKAASYIKAAIALGLKQEGEEFLERIKN
jgi:O-antigen ligase